MLSVARPWKQPCPLHGDTPPCSGLWTPLPATWEFGGVSSPPRTLHVPQLLPIASIHIHVLPMITGGLGRQNQGQSALSSDLRATYCLDPPPSLSPWGLSDLGSPWLSVPPSSAPALFLGLRGSISVPEDLDPRRSLSLVPHPALTSAAVPRQGEALAPVAGWLWSSLWVGSPRLLQRGARISNTCSLWQPATTAHCLPTSHFNLKRENCQPNVLATARVRAARGISQQPLPAAGAGKGLGKGRRAARCWRGLLAATLSGSAGSE